MTNTRKKRGVWAGLLWIATFGCTGPEPATTEQDSQTIQQNLIFNECGDGWCGGGENCSSCPEDCYCPAYCGNGSCDGSENCSSCAQDCGTCPPAPPCGDGTCNGGETCTSCAQDCGGCGGQWVNVKATWCNNTCSEGHDDAACLCEYQKGQWPGSPSSWNSCRGVSCCAYGSVRCAVGDPNCSCELEDGSDPERMRQWCFPGYTTVTCRAPYIAGSYTCSYNCDHEEECYISYPTSAPNYVYVNTPNGLQCTGENETGWWSLAAFRSFFFGTDTCTLGQQSPWDDYPLEAEICE